jgi:hypothetical protein
MSMTRDQLPTGDYPINPRIPSDLHRHIRNRIDMYRTGSLTTAPIYGIDQAGAGIYLVDGGHYYNVHTYDVVHPITIEYILDVRPPPKTSHSNWSSS